MRGSPVTFRRLNGGLNVMDSVYTLAEGQGKGPGCESRDCRNVMSTARGAIRTRYGSSVLAKPAVAIDSLYPLTAVGPRLIAQGGAALYSIDITGAITAITGTSGATAGKRWEWAQAVAQGGQGPLYGMDGAVAAQWTGVGVAAPMTANAGALPIGKYVIYHGNRLWVAGMAGYTPSGGAALVDPGSALVFSEPGAPRDYPSTNVVLFDPGDGEAISGIGTIGPYVVVFKPNKCWVVYDLDTGANRRISVNAGAVSHRSIAESPYGTFFLTKDQGVMTCDGQKVKRMSTPVDPLLLTLTPVQRQNTAGTWFNGHYYLSISQGGAVNDLTLDYQADVNAWWPHTLASQQWAVWDQGNNPRLYATRGIAIPGTSVFAIEQAFVPGYNQDAVGHTVVGQGVNYSAYWKGPFHAFGAPYLRKRVRRIRFDGKGFVTVYLARDFADNDVWADDQQFPVDPAKWGVNDGSLYGQNDGSLWGGGASAIDQADVLTPGLARAWSIVFRNDTSTDFEIDSYTFALTARKD